MIILEKDLKRRCRKTKRKKKYTKTEEKKRKKKKQDNIAQQQKLEDLGLKKFFQCVRMIARFV